MGSVPQDCLFPTHASDTKSKARVSPVLPTHWLRSEVLTTPSLGLINSLESLTELRETCTYVYQLIIKDTDEQPMAETHGVSVWEGARSLMPSPCWALSQHCHVFINPEAL